MFLRRGWVIIFVILAVTSNASAGEVLNKYLPKFLKADLEIRHRFEFRENFDFNDSREDKDNFHLLRTRLGLTYMPIKTISLYAQAQDARIANPNFDVTSAFENFMDIRQLYINYEDNIMIESLTMNKLSFRAGRQELSFGAQRLIGGFNWSNVAQTFDAARLGMHFSKNHLQIDIFGGDKTNNKTPREQDDLFDASAKDRMWGYYATAKMFHETLVENYLIHRETYKNVSFGPSGSSEIDDYTFGGRLKKSFSNGFDYELETAGQWGNFRDKDVRAMMAVGVLGYTFTQPWQPRIAVEYDYGSGDSDPNDKKMTTFDNLYPTNHLFYGFMDFFSLQNLNDLSYQLSFKPHKKVKVRLDYHCLFLDTPKDSFYSAGRAVTRTASSSINDLNSHVGNELDLVTDYKFNNITSVQIGYSHFFAGKYLQQTGANDDADFVYVQTTFSL